MKWILVLASLAGALAVMIGAFGAHAFPGWLEQQQITGQDAARRVNALDTGARYQMVHALALLAIGLWQRQHAGNVAVGPACLLIAGMLLFCGGLYAFALTDIKIFAVIVPLGGLSLILGWIGLALSFARAG